jgi:DNA modification methylase
MVRASKLADKIELWPIERLRPYEKNARTHSQEQVDQLVKSIEEFGFTNPILVDSGDGILAGHGRLMAAKVAGMRQVPVVVLDYLDEDQRRAYILADNKLAMNAGWDDEMLREEIEALKDAEFDLDLIGFSEEELEDLFDGEGVEQLDSEGLTDADEVPEPPEEPVSKTGDVWLLGKHRVMCGDSTLLTEVERLLNGVKPDLLFTDPPYNVAFNGRSGKHDVILNDDLADDDFDDFIGEILQTIKALTPPIYYIWCNWRFYATLQRELDYKACIVWAKNVFGMGRNYRHQHEFCLFNGSIDDEIKNESDLWQIAKDTNYVHPTQKPVALSQRALGNHRKAKNILDLFGGSGSTLIGCETMNRTAFVMELDPRYCDVIVKRWEDFTGKLATLEATGQPFPVEA